MEFGGCVIPEILCMGCEVAECCVCSEVLCSAGVMAELAVVLPSTITVFWEQI